VEDWAEIRRLYRAEGLPIKVIARMLGISRDTVTAALAWDSPLKYQRAQRGSIVEEVEPRIRELLRPTSGSRPLGWYSSRRLPRDHYVRCDANDYSVHPAAIGHRVLARADLDRVRAFRDGRWPPITPASGRPTRRCRSHSVEAVKLLYCNRINAQSERPLRDRS
jgi:hypothetical protein